MAGAAEAAAERDLRLRVGHEFLRMRHPQVEQIAVRRIAGGLLERRSEMRRTEADVIGQPSTPKIM
jgi:hypothetical protein